MNKGNAGVTPGKPVPMDMRAWVREVVGVKQLLHKFEDTNYKPNQKWVDKQHQYWRVRLETLLDTPPEIPSRHYWGIIKEVVLDHRRKAGRPKKGVLLEWGKRGMT